MGAVLCCAGLRNSSIEVVSAVPPTSMEEVSVSASPLLRLPEHLLALVVSEVQGGKNLLRTTCRSLCLAMNDCTSALAWTRPRNSDGGPVLNAHLPAALTGVCPSIKLLDCRGEKDARLEFSFASCPPSLHTLFCSFTKVQLLDSLAERCTMLQTLDCSNCYRVSQLDPLSACLMLQTLNCSDTGVSELGPLSACKMLKALDCTRCRMVSELGPLSACTMLRTLICCCTRVSKLGPLSACTLLRTLDCRVTGVSELGPLSACPKLQTLKCSNCSRVSELRPLSACPMLQSLICIRVRPQQARALHAACPNLRIKGVCAA